MEKLRLQPPDPDSDEKAPWTDGLITFCAFGLWSFVPIIAHCAMPDLLYPSASPEFAFRGTCFLTLLVLFGLGATSSRFTGKGWLRCGLEFFVMGIAVLLVAYTAASHVSAWMRVAIPQFFEDTPGS